MFPVDAFVSGKIVSLSYTLFCFSSKGNPYNRGNGKIFVDSQFLQKQVERSLIL